MPNYSKTIMIGHLTRDPQLSFLQSQTAVCEFGLAVTHKYKKQDGSQSEDTCFIDCKMFSKRAEVVSKYFKKGDPIFIEGRLTLDQWNAQDGSKRSKHRLIVENFEFIGKGGKQESQQPDQPDYGDSDLLEF